MSLPAVKVPLWVDDVVARFAELERLVPVESPWVPDEAGHSETTGQRDDCREIAARGRNRAREALCSRAGSDDSRSQFIEPVPPVPPEWGPPGVGPVWIFRPSTVDGSGGPTGFPRDKTGAEIVGPI